MKNTMYPFTFPCHTPIAFACGLFFYGITACAAPINFSQIPAGNGGREPAPNVIITVDDSGSMGWDINGCMTPDWQYSVYGDRYDVGASAATCPSRLSNTNPSRMKTLKQALFNTFGDYNAADSAKKIGSIADNRIRLAFQAMHDNGNFISSNGAKTLTLGAANAMRPYTGTHRQRFTNFVNSLVPIYGTPTHSMLNNVFNYMRSPAGTHSPWANNPGTNQTTPYLACRRTYHVLMTDGAWNEQGTISAGNADGTNRTLPDGTSYNISSDQTRPYRDTFGGTTGAASTVSDLAFRNWATDLQNGSNSTQNMANSIRPLIKQPLDEKFITDACKTANNCVALTPYWNPKNNPASWQHISQYTIGFGKQATNWTSTNNRPPVWDATTNDNYGSSFASLVNGVSFWGDVQPSNTSDVALRSSELWHMALNGRGKYYPAMDAEALSRAFQEIMDTVIVDTSSPLVSISTSSSYLRSGLNAFIAGYNATRYSGSLSARPIDATTGAILAEEVWDAAAKLDALSATAINNRLVLSFNGTQGFQWKAENFNTFPDAQKTVLNKDSAGIVDNRGADRVLYLRGDRTKEVANGGVFRDRDSRLGDVVNSNIWYTGKPSSGYTIFDYGLFKGTGVDGFGNRTPMIYVGANDGMLHGFSAESNKDTGGNELIAYIPQGIAQGALRELTDANASGTTKPYVHKYYVDGSPFTGDFYHSGLKKWRTYLVGTLAAGGKGYFILDVTDPSKFSSANQTVGQLVIMDTTATTDPDIGHIFSPPVVDEAVANMSRQIVQLNDSRWAVVLGNGYNSTNEAPMLLVQYLDGTIPSAPVKISPCALPVTADCSYKGTNGLSSPQLIDINGDGKVDVAYAGDLQGNLWKFDLSSKTPTEWKVAFDSKPFFVARRENAGQPIRQAFTTAPYWLPHPKGGIMLAIATGKNLTDADRETTQIESVYALYDNSTFRLENGVVKFNPASADASPPTSPINTGESTTLPTTLVQQTIAATPLIDDGTTYFTSSNNPVDYDGQPALAGPPAQAAVPPKRGWYLDFPLAGQRALQNIRNFSGQRIMIQSVIPKIGSNSVEETCSASATTERSFQTVLNMFTGSPPKTPVFTFKDETTFTVENAAKVTMVESAAGDVTLIRSRDQTKLLSSNCPPGQQCAAKDFNPGRYSGIRAGFRQLQ